MIKIQDVTVMFDAGSPTQHKAIDNLSLDIKQGDFITLIGGNGAGKSSLLKTISGEIQPIAGAIYIDEANVTDWDMAKRSQYVGHVFQDPRLGSFDALTVEENLAIAHQRGKKRYLLPAVNRHQQAYFKDKLKPLGVGLENKLHAIVGSLSGGQRQALSLIMASMNTPRILLLDEHTAALDPKTSAIILAMTKHIIDAQGLTAIMITHHLNQALTMGNRTILMKEGRMVNDLSKTERSRLTPADLLALF